MSDFTFIDSERNGKLLLCEGYKFTLHRKNSDGTSSWRCSKRKICSAAIKLSDSNTLIAKTNHRCAANTAKNEFLCTLQQVKDSVKHNFQPIQQIYEDGIVPLIQRGINIIEEIPDFSRIKPTLYRWRLKENNLSTTRFHQTADVIVPEKLRGNLLHEDLLEDDKIIIFMSHKSKAAISKYHSFFGDGTFSRAPVPYLQLYTLHCDVSGAETSTNIIPIIFALLPNKETKTYIRFLAILKKKLPCWKPSHFKIDFELSMFKAIRIIFPSATVSGCYFHYSQAIMKNAKKYKLLDNSEYKRFIYLCLQLPYLPSVLIPEGWLSITENLTEGINLYKFKDYFTKWWMSNKIITTISVYGEKHLTNNPVEGWHHRFNKKVPKKPNIMHFIEKINMEIAVQDFKGYKMKLHQLVKNRNKNYFFKQNKIHQLVKICFNDDITVYECLNKIRLLKNKYQIK